MLDATALLQAFRAVTRVLAESEGEPHAALIAALEATLGWEEGELRAPGEAEPGIVTVAAGPAGVLAFRAPEPGPEARAVLEDLGQLISDAEERRRSETGVRHVARRALSDLEARRHALLDVAFDSVVTMDHRGRVVEVNRAAERTFGYRAEEMVGREVADLIIPPGLREAHRQGLQRHLERGGGGPVVGRRVELTGMRADGSEFPVELVVTRPDVFGAPVFYGYLRDVTARHRAEASLHRLADEQAALRRVATAVAAGADAGDLFDLLSEEVGRLLGARSAHMYRYDAEGGAATVVGSWALAREQRLPAGTQMRLDGDSATSRVWRTGAPARMQDYTGVAGSLAATLRELGVQSVVAAPVSLEGRLWGGVVLSTTEDEPFPAGTEQRIADFAELAAQALANAQSREDLAASRARIVEAGDAERRRLERNLHDGAQQRLVSLLLMLRLLTRRLAGDPESRRALEQGTEELVQALDELRELARGLHPAILTERGLEPAIQALAARAPLPVEVDVALDERLPSAVEAAGYYVVAEALANVAKYAQASVVQVSVTRTGDRARIEVSDDGIGGARAGGGGSGLRGLADRVEALLGRLTIESPLGAGTTLRAEIPLAPGPGLAQSPAGSSGRRQV